MRLYVAVRHSVLSRVLYGVLQMNVLLWSTDVFLLLYYCFPSVSSLVWFV